MSNQSSGKPKPPLSQTRHKARHYAMQGLYQWQMSGTAIHVIEEQFRADYDMSKVDVHYFHDLLDGVAANLAELQELFVPLLDRELKELDQVETALLRLGSYEMLKRTDVPYKVVINEAVGLAKKFGAADSHKYVNSILDKLARKIRTTEIDAEA
ncbi:Transcription antitermination protein NusB [Sinobacterium norvegicum]|uniref:Transcription antitermination protein NusB n=1 Tax=Sinobacterium norvegicum TaxID=1641715 RepID=A0ABM9AET5_9GAMM|nr:transcription antitermination factor NusB [Sinobacterium norvegicum]CAH0991555.1 Transcription antitermination protein NusB [Sinobacterium norvegicum]